MENYCFVCGKELGVFYFTVVIEIKEEIKLVGICERCAYEITKEKEEENNSG